MGQLDALDTMYDTLGKTSKYEDWSDLPYPLIKEFITRAVAAIHRITGSNSVYAKQADEILQSDTYEGGKVQSLFGVIKALRADMQDGFLQDLTELLHGEIFSDFLEMAQHLIDEGYKDAAAVIAGSALEEHLRTLCRKHSIDTDVPVHGDVRPKKASQMNSDLAKANAYSRLDEKNVTAWLDLRNKAAHGKYNEYSKDQVALLIMGVRDFLTRNPA